MLLASAFSFTQQQKNARRSFLTRSSRQANAWPLYNAFYDEEEEDDEEDDEIDADSLGDWRDFRRNLAGMTSNESKTAVSKSSAGSAENEQVLRTQNEVLANEYKTGVWAHETPTVCCIVYT